MYVKLLFLISQVIFYILDVGVDIKIANEHRSLTFPSNASIAYQASKLLNRKLYIRLDKTFMYPLESLNYEPIHFLLTTTWQILGGLIQSAVILKNMKKQTYIPLIWKVAIIISSFLLMRSLFIYFFSIFIILTSNASIPEKNRILLLVGSVIKQMFV
jgi:hypothetical protein